MNLNKVQLIGRITRDPELRALPNGTSVVRLGLATNHVYKKDGEKKETTQFHTCVAYGKLADTINQYVTKGQEIYIEGRLEYRQWETKEGEKRNSTEIMVDGFQFGARPRGAQEKTAGQAIEESIGPDGEVNLENLPF